MKFIAACHAVTHLIFVQSRLLQIKSLRMTVKIHLLLIFGKLLRSPVSKEINCICRVTQFKTHVVQPCKLSFHSSTRDKDIMHHRKG